MIVIAIVLMVWLALVVLVLAALRSAALADRAEEERARVTPVHGRPHTAAVLVAVAMAPCLASEAEAQGADGGCEGADAAPALSDPHQSRDATLCLINQQRARRRLRGLQVDARLARAAHRHSADMVARGYFSHVSPSGTTMTDRLRRVGYITRRCAWRVGETLAWGRGTAATPRSRVRAWMRSRRHRAVLTNPAYRDIGIGVVDGSPVDARDGFTYGAEFGRRDCP